MQSRTQLQFASFMAARHYTLLRMAFLLVGDRGHAEHLVTVALYKTFCAWGRLQSPTAADAYTRTTMLHLAGRWGRRKWHGEFPTEISTGNTESESELTTTRPTHRMDPSESVVVAVDIHRALGKLPWPQRAVLMLRYFEDFTEARTAQALGCSIGTVKSRASGLRFGP